MLFFKKISCQKILDYCILVLPVVFLSGTFFVNFISVLFSILFLLLTLKKKILHGLNYHLLKYFFYFGFI